MAAPSNRRIVVTRRGGPRVFEVVREPLPRPGLGEARVRVSAAGISAYDAMVRSAWFPGNPRPPFTPGEDIVGVVDDVGSDVTSLSPGQRVAAWTFGSGGGYADFVCRPADELVPVPERLDDATAVATVVNYLTASLALEQTAAVEPGERVLVHGAAGGLGSALVQLADLAEAELYGTASGPNCGLLADMGATPIDYRTEDFVERIRELTGDGVDVVFDTVGGMRQLRRSYAALRPGGRLVPIGSVATESGGMKVIPLSLLTIAGLKLVPDGRRVPLSPNMTKYPMAHKAWYQQTLGRLLAEAAAGVIEPIIAARVPLGSAAHAHELLDRGGHAGKIVLVAGPAEADVAESQLTSSNG